MNATGYALDPRDVAGHLAELRRIARLARLPLPDGGRPDWAGVLFGDPAPEPLAFADPAAPDRALLAAAVELRTGLGEHLSTLPGRLLLDWLRDVLEVAPLGAAPDRVVAAATVEPGLAPVVLPAGSLLRGGKDSAGTERRYATEQTLTAHGATLQDARSYQVHRDDAGARTDTARSWATRGGPAAGAFQPFPGPGEAGDPAPHAWRLADPVLAFSGGAMTVRVGLAGGDARLLDGLEWWQSTVTGPARATQVGTPSADVIDVRLMRQCAPPPEEPGGLPWLEARLPADRVTLPAAPLSVTFTDVSLAVTDRRGVRPDAALYNEGVLDVSKEFQPFGPVARRGDAFYVRSDEAFGKPVKSLTVTIGLLSVSTGGVRPVTWGQHLPSYLAEDYESAVGTISSLVARLPDEPGVRESLALVSGLRGTSPSPSVVWQRRSGGAWDRFADTPGSLKTVTAPAVDRTPGPSAAVPGVFAEPGGPGGLPGRYVRAFLAEGDFGWSAYQRRIAAFAAAAANAGETADPDDLVPPDPPVVSALSLDYTTHPTRPVSVTATDGWTRRTWDPAAGAGWAPFAVPAEPPGTGGPVDAGTLALGVDLGAASLGSAVSLYLDVQSAAACGAAGGGRASWATWSADGWTPVDVADGTRGLRESGVLRFVAPADWPEGCPGAAADTGRWLRLVTDAPAAAGTLRAVVPDAVEAVYVSRQADPLADPTPATPLAAGQIKGLVTPVAGIPRLTNVTGMRGRAPETDEAYLRRATGTARHRGRAAQAWDYEELVVTTFPEVAAVRCLPHTGPDGGTEAGCVALVVLPAGAEDAPVPTVSLAGRIRDLLTPLMPLTARLAVLCPEYVPVQVRADILLARGVPALTGSDAILAALRSRLHPAATLPPPFGRELFASTVVAFLESLPEVDRATAFTLAGPTGATSRVSVDPCRGLVASGAHRILVTEQL